MNGSKILRNKVGRKVNALRIQGGIKRQEDLANAAGLSLMTVSRLERGEHDPKLSTLEKLANALGVTVGDLLNDQR